MQIHDWMVRPMTWHERFIDFFGLQKSIVALLFMAIFVGLGEKMAERFLPIYLLALGGGILSVGFLNGMDNLLSALYSFPGGYLSDRLGYKRALVVFNLVAITGYLIVILFPHWLAVIIGAAFFLSWSALSLPATMTLVSRSLPLGKRTMGVSIHSLVRRIPMAMGPVIGGVLIGLYGEKIGVRLAFVAAFLLGVVSLVLQQAMIEDDHKRGNAEKKPSRLWRFMSQDLRNLLVSDILIRFAEQIPYAFVVIWCIKINGISAVQFGLLTTVEMITAMLVYIPVAYLADRTTKKPFVLITFLNFTFFPLFLLFSHSFSMMVIAFIIRGLKEFGEPTRKALIMDLAPEDQKAGVFGLYYLIRDVIVSVAAFAGGFLWQLSPAVNLLTATACGVLGTLYFAIRGRDLKGS
ncbi:MAG: MFS transporter [Deltaproteobacteria bacterium RBG_16_58_17]|nr:MAG: MFS transporter [Deltaproteobacteria bacterium RBG_16_58_17]